MSTTHRPTWAHQISSYDAYLAAAERCAKLFTEESTMITRTTITRERTRRGRTKTTVYEVTGLTGAAVTAVRDAIGGQRLTLSIDGQDFEVFHSIAGFEWDLHAVAAGDTVDAQLTEPAGITGLIWGVFEQNLIRR